MSDPTYDDGTVPADADLAASKNDDANPETLVEGNQIVKPDDMESSIDKAQDETDTDRSERHD